MIPRPPKVANGARQRHRPGAALRRHPRRSDDGGDEGDERCAAPSVAISQASKIVDLAVQSDIELWHTPDGDAYCSIATNGHRESHPLDTRHVREFLARLFYERHGKTAPGQTAIQAAIGTLAGMAKFDGAERAVYLRTGMRDGRIYIDLGDPDWRAVQIDGLGWSVLNDPPVRFRRPRGLRPLPAPQRGGSLDDLQQVLNLRSRGDLALVVAWLLQALLPTGPYPTLILTGEQGTAKSTVTRVLRRLVDPNHSDLRSEPRDARDLAVSADNAHVLALDNLSRIPEWLSDALCRLATGGGFSTRTLYQNRDEEIFEAQRPVILNGIVQVATRPDLVDRAIVLTLRGIEDERRRDEAGYWATFDAMRPVILGCLFDAMVAGLARVSEVKLNSLPRMADFAKWGVATEGACPWPAGTFLQAFAAGRQEAVESVLDGDPVAEAIKVVAPWTGTAAELCDLIESRGTTAGGPPTRAMLGPRQVGDAVRRLKPALARIGIHVTFDRQPHTGRRLIAVVRSSAASPSSPRGPGDEGDEGDEARAWRHAESSGSTTLKSSALVGGPT